MAEKKEQEVKDAPRQQEVKISDNINGAEYANLMQVIHTREEFRLMFAHVFEPTGKVVGKIATTPAHFKRMVCAMQENLERYERANGKIKDIEGGDTEKIGFE